MNIDLDHVVSQSLFLIQDCVTQAIYLRVSNLHPRGNATPLFLFSLLK